jgi:hypothetical protein
MVRSLVDRWEEEGEYNLFELVEPVKKGLEEPTALAVHQLPTSVVTQFAEEVHVTNFGTHD